ncbi:MAG: hypothetical protein ACR2M3_02445 [Thermomicrobiales bacterium]
MQPPTGQFVPFAPQQGSLPVGWQPAIPVLLPAVPPPRLVPRTVPALVDEGVRVVRRDIGLFASAAALTVIPSHLLSAFISTLFTPFNPFDPATYARVGAHAAVTTNATATFCIAVIAAFITLAIQTLGTGALVTIAGLRTLGQPCMLGAAYAHARQRYWSLLGASLLSILAVGAVMAFTFSIGAPFALFLYVSWQLAPQAVVLEGRRARAGLARSNRLARGSWWRLAGLLIVVGILRLFAAAVPAGLGFLIAGFTSSEDLLGGGAGLVLLAVIASLVDVVMTPIAVTASTLFFSDLRLRREGFDIDLLLQRGAAERVARGAA